MAEATEAAGGRRHFAAAGGDHIRITAIRMVRIPRTRLACVDVVHAVTTPRFGPFRSY